MPNRPRTHRRIVLRLLAAAISATGAAAMAQEQSPYYIGVSQGFSRESNVLRTPTNETSDTISSTGVLAGVNLQLSRQRLFADATAQVNRYRKLDALNNKSYALRGGLDWETVENLSGIVHFTTRDNLSSFIDGGGNTVLSDQRTQELNTAARYGLASQLRVDVGYTHRDLKVKNATLANRDYKQDTVSAGLRWAVGGKLTLGAGVRATKGVQETVPVEDETKRRDLDLTAEWASGGFSTFNARISATREKHSLASATEVSETTGAISWTYRPTGRLNLVTSLSRDTGTETTFITPASSGTDALPVDNSRLSTSFALDTRYELTAKSAINASIRQRRGTLANSQSESIQGYTLGGTYTPTRSVALRCSIGRESRTVAGNNAYATNITGCSGDLTLR